MQHYSEPCARKQKNYMKKSFKSFVIFLLFLFIALPLFSKDYSDIFFYATRLFNEGACEEAEVEYKRYLFMQNYEKGQYETDAYCALAKLYEEKENYSLAADCINNAITVEECKAEKNESYIEAFRIAHIKYLELAYQNSDEYLSDNLFIFSYMNLPEISEDTKKCAYAAAISNAISKGRIEYAKNTFNQAVELFPQVWNEQELETINTSFEKLMKFKPKKQKLAGYLSFFPGLGQLYAANYKDSLNAFLLNGAIITACVWSICTLDFWTFSLLEFNPFMRFMQGNIYNAQKDAYQYNIKKQQELSAPICEILQNGL